MPTNATARAFHDLHHGPDPLVLPNAWDVLSACLIEQAGAKAIGTTSAGVAWSLGYPDGQHAPPAELLATVQRITAAVGVPVTVDVEAGYGTDPQAVARTVDAVLDTGAVGINLEDASGDHGQPLFDIDQQTQRIAAARAAADARGVPLFVNGRTDVYLRQVGDPASRPEHVAHRAIAYRDAGADGLFVPGLLDLATITWLADRVGLPVNVMAGPGAPPISELYAAGAVRISVGPALTCAAAALITATARTLLSTGGYDGLLPAIDYTALNELFDRHRSAAAPST